MARNVVATRFSLANKINRKLTASEARHLAKPQNVVRDFDRNYTEIFRSVTDNHVKIIY